MIATFCFVMANLMTKDKDMKQLVCGENSWLAAASVCISMCAQMQTAGPHSGALMNPAMSISQFIFGESVDANNAPFWGTYMVCPILGGILAGFYSWAHAWFVRNGFTDSVDAPVKEETEPL